MKVTVELVKKQAYWREGIYKDEFWIMVKLPTGEVGKMALGNIGYFHGPVNERIFMDWANKCCVENKQDCDLSFDV